MRLAISNIAWESKDGREVLSMLRKSGVDGIEIAPTKVWPDWEGATPSAAAELRKALSDEGFTIPSMQAIVYGKPDLQLFDRSTHEALFDHLRLVADLAAAMGAGPLVFGAPKNRLRWQLEFSEAFKLAVEVLQKIGEIFHARGVVFAWEPNPVEYGCDFITNVADGRRLVDAVASPGVKLHVDSAGLHLSGGDIGEALRRASPFVHFHASEPFLAGPDKGVVDHIALARVLSTLDYRGWVSIEMRSHANAMAAIAAVCGKIRQIYSMTTPPV